MSPYETDGQTDRRTDGQTDGRARRPTGQPNNKKCLYLVLKTFQLFVLL